MIDIIAHIPSLELFRAECLAMAKISPKYFTYNRDSESINYNVSKIPVRYNNDFTQSVCLVRLISDEEIEVLNNLSTVNRLGECVNGGYVFDSIESENIYNEVYDQTPIEIENGVFYTPPAMIGVFA